VGAAFATRLRELVARRQEPATRSFVLKLVMAFVITAVGGLAARGLGITLPREAAPLAWATLIGGIVILFVERWLRGKPLRGEVTWGIAVAMGIAQLLAAVFPGTSRSGATILVALALGLARGAATEFAFLLGVPTLLAAGGYEALQALRHPDPVATSSRSRVAKAAPTATAVPDWITTLKRSDWRGSNPVFSTRSRWPVEETGRNSVMPSMIPRAITAAQSGTGVVIRRFPRPRPPRSHCR